MSEESKQVSGAAVMEAVEETGNSAIVKLYLLVTAYRLCINSQKFNIKTEPLHVDSSCAFEGSGARSSNAQLNCPRARATGTSLFDTFAENPLYTYY